MEKCFDAVSAAVEEAEEKFGAGWVIIDEYYKVLEHYCEVFDLLAAEIEAISFRAYVDECDMTVCAEIRTYSFDISKTSPVFFELIRRASKLKFSSDESLELSTAFTFPTIWKRA